MKSRAKEILVFLVLIVLGLYFSIVGLVAAKGFLAPVALAILLSMILIPFSNKLENSGLSRGWSSFCSVIVTMLFFLGLTFIIGLQVSNVAEDWPKIKKDMKPKVERFQQWVYENTGLKPARQEKMVKKNVPGNSGGNGDSKGSSGGKQGNSKDSTVPANDNLQPGEKAGQSQEGGSQSEGSKSQGGSASAGSGIARSAGKYIFGFFGFLGTSLLTCIYIFFMLLYRRKLRKSILKFFPENKRENAYNVLQESVNMSQSYLLGRLLLIGFLILIYTLGLSVSGVKNAFLISILAAFLSLLPYIGNIIGFFLAMAMAMFSGGDLMVFGGVVITFTVAQFVESYILEPYVVGERVDINPLMTILVVVVGGAVWGVVGMIISIPVFGIFKIVFDRIKVLRPLGYTLGEEDLAVNEEESFTEKIARKIKEKFK